jgi:hypothetical protein
MIPRHPMIRLLGLLLLLLTAAPFEAAAQVTTPRTCSKSVFYDNNTNGATQIVPTATDRYAGNEIFICGYAFSSAGTVNVGLVTGTGTNCATNLTKITPAWQFLTTTSGLYSIVDGQATWRGLSVPAGVNLCINASTGTSVQAIIYYDNNPL